MACFRPKTNRDGNKPKWQVNLFWSHAAGAKVGDFFITASFSGSFK
jgi:hypothetical protein